MCPPTTGAQPARAIGRDPGSAVTQPALAKAIGSGHSIASASFVWQARRLSSTTSKKNMERLLAPWQGRGRRPHDDTTGRWGME